MDIKSINRRLDVLQRIAVQNRPCRVTIHFSDGSKIVKNPLSMWEIYFDHAARENVVNIIADSPQYQAAASILAVLCHPAENRRLENYV